MLPKDPFLLLSIANTKLRAFYKNLDLLCDDLGENRKEIEDLLSSINYHYDQKLNRFV